MATVTNAELPSGSSRRQATFQQAAIAGRVTAEMMESGHSEFWRGSPVVWLVAGLIAGLLAMVLSISKASLLLPGNLGFYMPAVIGVLLLSTAVTAPSARSAARSPAPARPGPSPRSSRSSVSAPLRPA